ncbi:ankyrin repeat domain-containing protein [Streptomyces sp. NPDC050738]|uniref:ankyrin repeat domain-containing protein n=1 Tax=Streptomyces sp. NPDC050738 TaxID=3154744 RepID=UPI00342B200C
MGTVRAESLVSAVRAGNVTAVRNLLALGADPNEETGADGLPVLCTAVAAYDAPVAEALVEGGADPDCVLPDGTTPLWRAVDGGSPAVFTAVLGQEPRLRLPEDARTKLLALARSWYETGAEAELRRRTGAPGPATRLQILDDPYTSVDQVSLGGQDVRAGHGAILTSMEWAFRILTPVEELIRRAVLPQDEDHVDWWEAASVLGRRGSTETRSAVLAYRHHPDPLHRRFVVLCLWMRAIVGTGGSTAENEEADFLAAWASEETDGETLAKVLDAFTEHEHPRMRAIVLRHIDHPDPRVRREVPCGLPTLDEPLTPEAREALLTLMHDRDADVRLNACRAGIRDEVLLPQVTQALLILAVDADTRIRGAVAADLAACRVRTPEVSEALWGLLDEDDQLTRLEAAYGLALRDDPRTGEAADRVGPLAEDHGDDHRVSALWDWHRNPL